MDPHHDRLGDAHRAISAFITCFGAIHLHDSGLPPASEIALEATGHWYWMVDEMEKAGHRPHLVNPTEAKRRMGKTNKTDAGKRELTFCIGHIQSFEYDRTDVALPQSASHLNR